MLRGAGQRLSNRVKGGANHELAGQHLPAALVRLADQHISHDLSNISTNLQDEKHCQQKVLVATLKDHDGFFAEVYTTAIGPTPFPPVLALFHPVCIRTSDWKVQEVHSFSPVLVTEAKNGAIIQSWSGCDFGQDVEATPRCKAGEYPSISIFIYWPGCRVRCKAGKHPR